MKTRDMLDPHQEQALNWTKAHGSGLLALEMGIGKSVISATYAEWLQCSGLSKHCLIVAPKKVALNTWPEELAGWEHLAGSTVNQLTGMSQKEWRVKALTPTDYTIINRENLTKLIEFWKGNWPYDTVILDEAGWCCGATGTTFKSLKKVRNLIDYVVELTGTPAPNGHIGLFGLAYMVDKGATLGTHVTHYRKRYFDKNMYTSTYDIKDWAEEVINKKMRDIALYMSVDDYHDLPPFVIRDKSVELPQKLRSKYDYFFREFILETEGMDVEDILADNSAIRSNKLLQFCNGSVYDEDKNAVHFHDEKLDMLQEIVDNSDTPILCAYSYKHDIPRLKKRFPKATFYTDDTTINKRWNTGKIPLLFCHPASAGHGLNLQFGGNHVVWFGLTWSLELYWQFMYRLRRRGQEADHVFATHLTIKDSIEQRLLAALNTKGITQQELLDTLRIEDHEYRTN